MYLSNKVLLESSFFDTTMGKSKAVESGRKSSALRKFKQRLKSPGVKQQLMAHSDQAGVLPAGRKKRKLRARSTQKVANMKFKTAKDMKTSYRAPTLESVATKAIIKRMRDHKPDLKGNKEREKRFHAILGLVRSNPADLNDESSSDGTAAESTVDHRPEEVISSESMTSSPQSSSSPEDGLEIKHDRKSPKHEFMSPITRIKGTDEPYPECVQMNETAMFLAKGLEVELIGLNQAPTMAELASNLRALFHDADSENEQNIVTNSPRSPCNLPPFLRDLIAGEESAKPSREHRAGLPNPESREDFADGKHRQEAYACESEPHCGDWSEKVAPVGAPADDECARLQALLEEAFPSDRQTYSTRKSKASARFGDRDARARADRTTDFFNQSASTNGHVQRPYASSSSLGYARPQPATHLASPVKAIPDTRPPPAYSDIHRLVPLDCRTPGEEDFKLLNMRAFAAIAGCSAPSPDLYGKPYSVA